MRKAFEIKGSNLLRSSVWITAGQVALAGLQWLFLLLLIQRYDESVAGSFSLVLAVVSPVFLFFDFNLRVVRSTQRTKFASIQSYLWLRTLGLLFASLLCYLIAKLYFPLLANLLAVGIVLKSLESMSSLAYGQYQRDGQSWMVGASMLLRSAGYLTAVLAIVFFDVPFNTLCWILCLALVSFASFDIRTLLAENYTARGKFKVKFDDLCRSGIALAIISMPLAFDALVSSLTLNVGRYVISDQLGLSVVAVYSLLFQGAFVFQFIIGSLGHASIGTLSAMHVSGDQQAFYSEFWKLIRICFIASGLFAIGALSFESMFFHFAELSDEKFSSLYRLMILASIVAGIQRMFGRALQSIGGYKRYLFVDMVLFIIVTLSTIVLVPKIGHDGAAISLIFGFFTTFCLTYALTKNVVQSNIRTI